MGVDVPSLLSASTAGRVPRAHAALLALLVVMSALIALPAVAQPGAPPTVTVTTEGFDRLIAGVPSRVHVTVRVTDIGSLRSADPLRLLGSLTTPTGDPVTGATVTQVDGPSSQTELTYTDGTFVAPHEDAPALSLAATPALTSAAGATFAFDVTVPTTDPVRATISLVRSNERAAAVVRRAGSGRVETAAAISAATFNPGVAVAYVTREDGFADALAVGPAAGSAGAPVLLTSTATLPDATRAELERLTPASIVVLGGPNAVSDAVLDALRPLTEGTVTRIAGSNRFATAAAIAKALFPAPVGEVFVATGATFADALAGGPAAALSGAPILLVEPDAIPAETRAALEALDPSFITVLGGPRAISDGVVGGLAAYAPVTRLFGPDRYATAARIAEARFNPDRVTVVYLATGLNFPDAIAGVPAATVDGAPILLVQGDTIPQATADALAALRPAIVILLGGPNAVGPSVETEAAKITTTAAPDRQQFEPIATSDTTEATPGEPLAITAPTSESPRTARPGDRFTAEIVTPRTGTYTVAYRRNGDATWTAFRNPTATGDTTGGPLTVALNAPLIDGVYDLQLTATDTTGSESVIVEDVLTVALTFPPPLISSLIESTAGQSQLIAVRPIGGLEEGTQLDIELTAGETTNVDYPLVDGLTQLNGTGTSTLIVSRDGRAIVRYTAGPADRVDPDVPTSHPLLTFRIDGIDVGAGDASHVGRFFRYDIMHGVNRVFTTGGGSGIASPTASNVQRGSGHTPQRFSFAVPAPLGAYQTVTIDLSDAERSGVNYIDAFAYLEGVGHGEPTAGTVRIEAVPDESARLVFTAGPDGLPSVQPEGPIVSVFVGGVSVDDVAASPTVSFTRSDTGSTATTTFDIASIGLFDLVFGDLPAGAASASQPVSVTLDGELPAGNQLSFEVQPLIDAGLDYSTATVSVVTGSGTAGFLTHNWGGFTYTTLQYESDGDPSGPIELLIEGIATPDEDGSHLVWVSRYDSYATASAVFDVGAGSKLAGVRLGDLTIDAGPQSQYVVFASTEDLAPGTNVAFDLSEAQAATVDYNAAVAYAYDESGGEVALAVDGDTATLTYTAGEGGLPTGSMVYLDLSDVQATSDEATYTVPVTVDGVAAGSTRFSVVRYPGLSAATATSLAADAVGLDQTISFTVVGDSDGPLTVEAYLGGPEQGGARYGGASVSVVSEVPPVTDPVTPPPAPGAAVLDVYPGQWASVRYTSSETLVDGTVVTLRLRGVNTDAVDETHIVDLYRYDSYRSTTARFDIGAGGAFLGVPSISELFSGDTAAQQYLSFALTRDALEGEQITVDLSAGLPAGVSYTDTFVETYSDLGTWELSVPEGGGSALLTFTVGVSGLRAGSTVDASLVGIDTTATTPGTTVPVTFRDVLTDRTLVRSYDIYGWHEGW